MSTEKQATVWLSLGENCLPDDILKRHKFKSYSSPYSSARSNIDYALALEEDGYSTFLDPETLVRGEVSGAGVVRSAKFVGCDPIYRDLHMNGFEFTHLDVISSPDARASYERKAGRMLELRGKRDVVFLYLHRHSATSNLPMLRAKLERFADLYRSDTARCTIALFYQMPLSSLGERRIETNHSAGLLEFVFHTQHEWAGKDQNIFWARNDDDLIAQMLGEIAERVDITSAQS
jgi:hypothetical protein